MEEEKRTCTPEEVQNRDGEIDLVDVCRALLSKALPGNGDLRRWRDFICRQHAGNYLYLYRYGVYGGREYDIHR
mgnify:CR=1 FL=1